MIDALISWSVRNRWWVVVLTLLVALLGARQASSLRFDAFPDLTNVQVQVLTTSPGMGSEEIEMLVTAPLERSLTGMPGMVELRSVSSPGISAITAVFDDGTDLWRARQVVKERVDDAAGLMPPQAGQPGLAPPSTGLGEVWQFTLVSDRMAPFDLYRIFQRDVAPRLRQVSGVVEVNAWGAGAPRLEVIADPWALAARGIPLSELEDAVQASLGITSGGAIVRGAEQDQVRAMANPTTPEALSEVFVRHDDVAGNVRVGDVATVERAGALRVGLGTANAQGEVLFGMVQLLAGADARSTVEGIRATVDSVRAGLPDGVELNMVYDREKLVGGTLKTVEHSLLEGGALVILVLLVLLGDLRAGLLVASVIPLSMLGALAGLELLGLSGNLMSLGAIDFGLVVDGTVVVVEALMAMEAVRAAERDQAFTERTGSVARPVLFAVAILLLVYLPIVTMGGTEGKLFRPMATTVLLALTTALVLSFTWIPAASAILLRPHGDHPPRIVQFAAARYRPVLAAALARPFVAAGFAVAALVASLVVGSQLGVQFTPRLEEGDLTLQAERLPSISPAQAVRENTRLERILATFPEVISVAIRTGSPAVATDPMGMNDNDIMIRLKPKPEWTTAATLDGLIAAMSEALTAGAPGQALTFTQPIEMRFNEMLEGVPSDVGVLVYGRDLAEMTAFGHQIAEALATVEGAADIRVPALEGVPVQEVQVDEVRAAGLGIRASDVLAMVEALQIGRPVGEVLAGEFRDAVVVRVVLPDDVPVTDLPVLLPDGIAVPLSEVATVTTRELPAAVRREGGSRRILVQANVRGRDLGSFVRDAQVVVGALTPPEGMWLDWRGKYEQLQEATHRTLVVLPLVLGAILALLRLAFGAVRPAALIFLNVPVAVSGGIFSLFWAGLPISMSAIVGFIALSGIAVMNGVVLIARIQELGLEHDARTAAWRGALERFRPVLMTATVAGLGFIPMAFATGVGAEVQRPLALVVLGGLGTSTLLTLVVLPGLAARWLPGHGEA